ncbi:MAG: DUF4175 family protein, partial [Rhizobiaceae bacterium]|nr:DUF4175 family protein [Rhizobiaceae bacterium]
MATRQDDAGSAVPNRTAGLSLTRRSAGLALILERVWPTLFASSAIVAVFFVLSWFGIFAASPWPVRVALLAGLCGGIGIVLWRARAVRLPSVAEIDQRIEAESRLDHQPLQAQVDRPTNTDPFAAALWREHQRRMAERLKNLSGGAPRTRTERLDPLGLRALLAMLLVTGFAFSYGSGGGRVSDAFVMSEAAVAVSARVDAWVTPPSYTGRAPIFLTDAAVAGEARGPVEVPEGSVLSVRVSDGSDTKLTFTPTGGSAEIIEPGPLKEVATPEGGDAATPDGPSTPAASPGAAQTVETTDRQAENAVSVATAPAEGTDSSTSAGEFEFRLTADGSADLSTTFRSLGRWTFAVMPDVEPIVAFVGEPAEARN